MEENTPPPFDGAQPDVPAAPETPMYGSTASGKTDEPAAPAFTFLQHAPRGFWD